MLCKLTAAGISCEKQVAATRSALHKAYWFIEEGQRAPGAHGHIDPVNLVDVRKAGIDEQRPTVRRPIEQACVPNILTPVQDLNYQLRNWRHVFHDQVAIVRRCPNNIAR